MGPVLGGGITGLLFGVGLALSGMAQPGKVLAFLDVTGAWDPSLAFVMGGAIGVYAPLYHWITKRTMPRYAREFVITLNRKLDGPLIAGAALFGLGWGLGGYCPGPGIVSAGTGATQGVVFLVAMLAGMFVFDGYERVRAAGPPSLEPAE